MADTLNDALAVIRAATLLSGDLKMAASWYFADGIDVFGGLTAEALVLQGRAHDVLRYIESLEAGFSGWQLSRVIYANGVDVRSGRVSLLIAYSDQIRHRFRFNGASVSDSNAPQFPIRFHHPLSTHGSARRLRRVARAGGRACGQLVFSAQDACLRRGCRH